MKRLNVSMKLILKASQEGWMKQLALYYLLKNQYQNSCIYGYKGRMSELALILGISQRTIHTYIQNLRSKELVYDHNKNLILSSLRKSKGFRHKCIIIIENSFNLNDIVVLLQAKILEQEGRKQAFMESIRRFEKGDQHIDKHGESPFSPSMSIRTISKYLHVSKTKATKVIRDLNRIGVLLTEEQKPVMLSKDAGFIKAYVEDCPGYRFRINNRLYERYGNRHSFLQFPIFLKKITIGKYMGYKRHRKPFAKTGTSI